MSPEFIDAMRRAVAGALPPTQERLRELLEYDPETGEFRWRVPGRSDRAKVGDVAGYLGSHGYIVICADGREFLGHKLAWVWVYGVWATADLDHINRVRTDNRIANLRLVTPSENTFNAGLRSDNTSGYRGISWDSSRRKWCAYIAVNGKLLHLGRFASIDDAIAARQAAEVKFFGHLLAGGSSLPKPFRRRV